MNYQEAIEFFDTLDGDAKTKEVYAYFGLANFFAQLLEQQALNMICIRRMANNEVKTSNEIEELWNKYDFGNRTLGVLVNEIKQLYDIPEEVSKQLTKLLRTRNYLIHDYFRFNSELFYSDLGMKRMIKDFIEFRDDVRSMDKIMESYFLKYRLAFGITDELIKEIMNDVKQESLEINISDYQTIKKP